jgi:hypothetical protein
MKREIRDVVEGEAGFYTGLSLSENELDKIRCFIREQWLSVIAEWNPSIESIFRKVGINRYHEYDHLLDHSSIWQFRKRILCAEAVDYMRGSSLFKALASNFGDFRISGEHGVSAEEIVWRLVRPNAVSDVGPLHADEWFWALGNGTSPDGYQRFKVWISIFGEPGNSGFKFVSGSHKNDWNYQAEVRDGLSKPRIVDDISHLNIESFRGGEGEAIIFHDKLLHTGGLCVSTTRVSIEFTIFIKAT